MTIIPFSYDGQQVRVVERAGDPWWVAKDVCDILGLTNVGQAVAHLDEDEKSNITIADVAQNGGRKPLIISEAGLYSLILRSRRPEARAFKRWVTHEVLPSVRRRGGYLTPEAAERALTDPDFIIRIARDIQARWPGCSIAEVWPCDIALIINKTLDHLVDLEQRRAAA